MAKKLQTLHFCPKYQILWSIKLSYIVKSGVVLGLIQIIDSLLIAKLAHSKTDLSLRFYTFSHTGNEQTLCRTSGISSQDPNPGIGSILNSILSEHTGALRNHCFTSKLSCDSLTYLAHSSTPPIPMQNFVYLIYISIAHRQIDTSITRLINMGYR